MQPNRDLPICFIILYSETFEACEIPVPPYRSYSVLHDRSAWHLQAKQHPAQSGKRHQFLPHDRLLHLPSRSRKMQAQVLKFFGNLCNTGRRFPHGGLAIQTAFSGDDNICIFYIVGKMGFFQNDVYTGFQSGMEKGEKSKPKATGSPGSCMRGFVSGKLFPASAA